MKTPEEICREYISLNFMYDHITGKQKRDLDSAFEEYHSQAIPSRDEIQECIAKYSHHSIDRFTDEILKLYKDGTK